MSPLIVALWIAALINLAAIAVIDARRRIIPDKLVLVMIAAGIALRLSSTGGSLWLSSLGAAAIFVILGVIAHCGAIGGGDVKLISATSLLVSVDHLGAFLLDITVAGGVLSALYLVARLAKWAGAWPRTKLAVREKAGVARAILAASLSASLPYGVAVFIGITFYFGDEALRCLSATSCSF